jgi:hypothetical protein
MKKAMIAASIVGAAAAGVIIYLSRKNNMQRLLDGASSVADDATQLANRHLRKGQKKVNNIIHEATME